MHIREVVLNGDGKGLGVVGVSGVASVCVLFFFCSHRASEIDVVCLREKTKKKKSVSNGWFSCPRDLDSEIFMNFDAKKCNNPSIFHLVACLGAKTVS